MSEEKSYDPLDATLIFVNRPDEIDPHQDESCTAEMSCGHAVTPVSLTGWCRYLLAQGQYTFKCPALQPGGTRCDAEWSYREIRRLALLTVEEMEHFEKELAHLAVANTLDIKACPGCGTTVERKTLGNLCFTCTICKESKKPSTQFCWQCLKPWKGSAPRSDRCDNDGCVNQELELLKGCGTITLSQVEGVGPCPSIRACPTCGLKVEHDKTGCKNILCPRCQQARLGLPSMAARLTYRSNGSKETPSMSSCLCTESSS
ncbi:unnamed protein product [Lota lota]